MQLADINPLGLGRFGPGTSEMVPVLEDGLKGGFAVGVAADAGYDSNIFLSAEDPESEVLSALSASITYLSDPEGGARVALTATYAPSMRAYVNNTDLNGFDQRGDMSITFTGSKSTFSAYTKYNEIAGSDRLTGVFVDGMLINSGAVGSYQIAPRTTLFCGLSAAVSDYETDDLVGAEIYSAELGAMWDASERLRVGPSIRYSLATSDITGDQNAWGFLVNAGYRAGQRIQLRGSLGLESAESSREGQNSASNLTGDLSSTYGITERLSWANAIRYATIPSPTESSFIQNLSVATALSRVLTWGTLSTGLDLNFSDYENIGTIATSRGLERNIGVFLIYRREIISDRIDIQSKIRYAANEGLVDWNQLQVSLGLSVQF